MKRGKVYKPRRGIRFDRSIQQGPAASFLGGDVTIVTLTGSVMRSVTGSLPSSKLSGTFDATKLVNNMLLGLPSVGLGKLSTSVTTPRTGSIPSWTNVHLGGGNRAFVSTALTSSDYDTRVHNTYLSGSESLESSAVPASASMYFGKNGRYRHVIVKKTASVVDLNRLPTTMDGGTPVYYVPGKGTDISSVTGNLAYAPTVQYSMQRSTAIFPAMIPIDVPHSGRIVDIKVWVELMQTSGSSATDLAGYYPLGLLLVALRSPNLSGFHAIPIRNDPVLKKIFTSDLAEFSKAGIFGAVGKSLFGPDYITPFYRDSFLLWEGGGWLGEGSFGPWDTDTESGVGGEHFVTKRYPSWQRDRSMRTVFADGARIQNPRHHYATNPSGSYNGAPNSYHGFNNAYGFDVPWTSETEISGAGTYVLNGSPPKGWLTGPGGSNLTDEWPTTGVNYGADYIRPLYPLLDPLYQRKRYDATATRLPQSGSSVFDPGKWVGYRPGLRGTEASGTWYIMLADNRAARSSVSNYTPTYFRQVRLEFILESGSAIDNRGLRNQPRIMARRAKSEVLSVTLSGSDIMLDQTGSWDNFISDTYISFPKDDVSPEVGRTVGIGILTGSAEATSDFALLYRLTGTLADLSGSGPGWLLNNQFGTPWIPISSASLVPHTTEPVVGLHPQDVLTVRPILDGARRLSDAARDALPVMTLVQQYQAAISGTST